MCSALKIQITTSARFVDGDSAQSLLTLDEQNPTTIRVTNIPIENGLKLWLTLNPIRQNQYDKVDTNIYDSPKTLYLQSYSSVSPKSFLCIQTRRKRIKEPRW